MFYTTGPVEQALQEDEYSSALVVSENSLESGQSSESRQLIALRARSNCLDLVQKAGNTQRRFGWQTYKQCLQDDAGKRFSKLTWLRSSGVYV